MIVTKLKVAVGRVHVRGDPRHWDGHVGQVRASSKFPRRRDERRGAREKPQPAPGPQKPLDKDEEISVAFEALFATNSGHPWPRRGLAVRFACLTTSGSRARLSLSRDGQEPFRDGSGRVVPPGLLGKYFELR